MLPVCSAVPPNSIGTKTTETGHAGKVRILAGQLNGENDSSSGINETQARLRNPAEPGRNHRRITRYGRLPQDQGRGVTAGRRFD